MHHIIYNSNKYLIILFLYTFNLKPPPKNYSIPSAVSSLLQAIQFSLLMLSTLRFGQRTICQSHHIFLWQNWSIDQGGGFWLRELSFARRASTPSFRAGELAIACSLRASFSIFFFSASASCSFSSCALLNILLKTTNVWVTA